jgi:YVTN family beta-propeller protein
MRRLRAPLPPGVDKMLGVKGFILAMLLVSATAAVSLSSASRVQPATGPLPAVVATVATGTGSDPYFNDWYAAGDFFAVALFGAAKLALIGAVNHTLFKNVTVQAGPTGVTIIGANAWVMDRTTGNVSVVSLATFSVTHTIKVGTQPIRAAYDATNNTVFVSNFGGTNLTVINATTFKTAASVTTGAGPIFPLWDNDTNELIVSDYTAGEVQFINATTYASIATLTGLSGPSAMSNDAAEHVLFVSDFTAGEVSVVSHKTHAVLVNITVGSAPYGNGFDTQTNYDLTPNSGGGTVSVINAATNTVIGAVNVGTTPYSVHAYDSVDGLLAVDNYGSGNVSILSDGTGGSGGAAAAAAATANVLAALAILVILAVLVLAAASIAGVQRRGKKGG